MSSSAKRGDTRLIAIVLGSKTSKIRNNDIASMLNYGFANYTLQQIYKKGEIIKENINIYGSKDIEISAICSDDVNVFIKKSDKDLVTTSITFENDLTAPIIKGNSIGTINIYVDNVLFDSIPIITNRDVVKAKYFDCFRTIVKMFIKAESY